MAILQLADEERIELKRRWFATCRGSQVSELEDDRPITIAHLLSHTAGIVAGIDATPEAAFQVWALRELPRFSRPGERFHYSNVGYKALGLVLEAVEGRPYRDVLRTRILDPLGMSATEPAITHAMRSRLAVGYDYLHDDRIGHAGAELAPATWLETGTADGSIASTATDMCVFVRALLSGGRTPAGALLAGRSFDRMTSGHAHDPDGGEYGYGLSIHTVDGRRFVGHGGGMVGYAAGMETDPEAGLGAVVLQNAMNLSPMALARTVIRILRDGRDGTPAPPGTSAHAADSGRGIACRDLRVRRAGHRTDRDRRRGADDSPPRPGGRTGGARGGSLPRRRTTLSTGFPSASSARRRGAPELWHGGRRYVRAGATARRLPEPRDELRAIAGHYRSHNPWTTNFRVQLRGDRPWLFFASAPDGFAAEQELEPLADGSFRVGDDPGNPESLRFDTVVGGRALRAWLSGCPYYRAD